MVDIKLGPQPAVPDHQLGNFDVYKVTSSRWTPYKVKVPPGIVVYIENDRYASSPSPDVKSVLPNIECDGTRRSLPDHQLGNARDND